MTRKSTAEKLVPAPQVTGEVVIRPLADVKPNDWNPNKMTPFQMESLKQGFRDDGWLASQSLLIWGSDEKGRKKNIIINGEHRWTAAQELGFIEAPMVFLERISKAEAMALTIRVDQKHGEPNEAKLAKLIGGLKDNLSTPNFELSIGIEKKALEKLLATRDVDPDEAPITSSMAAHAQQVPLFFSKEQHAEFSTFCRALGKKYKTLTVSETVLAAFHAMEKK